MNGSTAAEDILLPLKYCRTAKNEQFLLYDSGRPDRKLIFATKENLQILAKCNEWFMDSTFNTVTKLGLHLITIEGKFESKILPLVYIFLADKCEDNYSAVLGELKHLQTDLNPTQIISDFEMSSILACRKVFPQAILKGCLFHFKQCIWRHIENISLDSAYGNDADLAHHINMLYALAFVPANEVITAFDELIRFDYYRENKEKLCKLIEYFERTWIGVAKRGTRGRSAAIINLEMWNHYSSELDDLLRTSSHVEEWHKRLTAKAEVKNSTLCKFLDAIISEQAKVELDYQQYISGSEISNKRRKYKDMDAQIKNIVLNYKTRKIYLYLSGIAYNTML